ncbi:MAG: hypothetical protein UU87_C0002G0056 [Parcubacteria group bacterium GW2011_GWA2_42_11]|nr:MAG: hypothetical protein UU87_C0002G0056 [Parcubacteria group bacterium GW2011_GWA2_42_11]
MQYQYIWDKVLNPDETVQYEFSVGFWFRFLMTLFLGLVIAVVLGALCYYFDLPYWPAGLFGLGFFLIYNWYIKIANAYAFTNKRVISHRGWLWTRLITVDFEQITDVICEEPFFEKLIFGTGYMFIDTAGTDTQEISFMHLADPYKAKKILDSLRAI